MADADTCLWTTDVDELAVGVLDAMEIAYQPPAPAPRRSVADEERGVPRALRAAREAAPMWRRVAD